MRNIALMGRARSGKDTIAERLVKEHGYERVAFADPLKEMALQIDPLIPTMDGIHVRLRALVRDTGWEYAKDHYPEVRRLLQYVGQSVRAHSYEDFWRDLAMRKVSAAIAADRPVVVTDCRYLNEAQTLSAARFLMVRVIRPGGVDPRTSSHESERALAGFLPDSVIRNDGTVADLWERADVLVR
ncbi:deoxynucleotide monophosphate kinase family protein [Streptomyces sp. SP17KL33]|uniref:deoxynucleotide monophosphate kinase family protein n=1 Tax=Streptomyces sp. SP17KL33 TaxID=3002534 RepID=UPI002E76203F|nr:hypothetical protein [Streptomyces sp. SP17KL33]MEE1835768.1 hypothetical protein [Streptomyces sp. SP17KL33]